MTSQKRGGAPIPFRKLKSGSVVRMHSHNRMRKAGDDGATTPDVDITVKFEDRYLHRAQESPDGSLEGTVRLKFAPASAPGEPRRSTVTVKSRGPGIVPPKSAEKRAAESLSPNPPLARNPALTGKVAPPPPLPARNTLNRPPPRAVEKPPARKRSWLIPLAMTGTVLAAVLIPSQLGIGPIPELLGKKEEVLTAQVLPAEPSPSQEDVLLAAKTISKAKAEALTQTTEIRVAAGPEPELTSSATISEVALSAETETEQTYSAALGELDRLKAEPVLPPKPQKLSPPSDSGKLDFASSRPVTAPPDPNEMAVVPVNSFAAALPESLAQQPVLSQSVAPPPVLWAAAALISTPRTDLPATASPTADPPPAKPGPEVLANITAPRPAKVNPNLVPVPFLSAGPDFEWRATMALHAPGPSGDPYQAPLSLSNAALVAAVAIVRPDAPSRASAELDEMQVPSQILKVDLRQQFIKPPKENRNSDSAVDADISTPSVPPAPKLGEGKLKILSQYWQSQLDLEFDDESGIIRIGETTPDDPEWLIPGAQITTLNGVSLSNRAEYLIEMKGVCEVATSGKADIAVTVNGTEHIAQITCTRRTALSNGLVLEAKYKRRKWKINVVEEAVLGLSDLKSGDHLVIDYGRDQQLDSPEALRETITSAIEINAQTIELGIIRDGAIENAKIRISGDSD